MTVNKLTLPSKENAVQEKINEIIDNLGTSSGANTDLSNLSATGEAHFLKPTITQDVTLGDSNTYNITVKAYNSNLDMNVACMQLYSSNNTLYVGNNGTTLGLRGDTTRPQYNGDDLALSGDLTSKADTDLSNITTVNTPITTTAINPIVNKLTNADITTAPSADIDTGIIFRDNNNINLAGFTTTRFTNGVQSTAMVAVNKISGTSKTAYFNVYVNPSGNDIADGSSGVKSSIAGWSMPKVTTAGVGVVFDANGNYTPNKDGYLLVGCLSGGASSIAYLWVLDANNTPLYGSTLEHTTSGYVVYRVIPVVANQTVHIDYLYGMTFNNATFIELRGN